MIRTLRFTETIDGATYTASTSIPAGGRILDVLLETTAAWTAATAPLDVGDADASDALVGAEAMDGLVGKAAAGAGGTDWGNGLGDTDGPQSAGGPGKSYPAGGTITAVVTPTVPGGPTGLSAVTLLIELPGVSRRAVVTT